MYQSIVKPQIVIKTNEMFLPGRMSFIFNMVRTPSLPCLLFNSSCLAVLLYESMVVDKLVVFLGSSCSFVLFRYESYHFDHKTIIVIFLWKLLEVGFYRAIFQLLTIGRISLVD